MATHYAVIDSHDPVSGAVYGTGPTKTDAIEDAVRQSGETAIVGAEDSYSAVPITPAAFAYVQDRGGAPSADLVVARHLVMLRGEEG
jgi:phosphoenolpyruvate synthase/pyruvate phosphate dikinase